MATAQPEGPTQSEPHQPLHLFDLHLVARTHPAVVADLYQVRRHHVLQQVVHETFVCNGLVLKHVSLATNPASPLSTSCGNFRLTDPLRWLLPHGGHLPAVTSGSLVDGFVLPYFRFKFGILTPRKKPELSRGDSLLEESDTPRNHAVFGRNAHAAGVSRRSAKEFLT